MGLLHAADQYLEAQLAHFFAYKDPKIKTKFDLGLLQQYGPALRYITSKTIIWAEAYTYPILRSSFKPHLEARLVGQTSYLETNYLWLIISRL